MAWIEMVSETEASGKLAELYARIAPDGAVPNILKVQSLRPRALEPHLAMYRNLMFASGELSRATRETIAVAVSVVNGCHY